MNLRRSRIDCFTAVHLQFRRTLQRIDEWRSDQKETHVRTPGNLIHAAAKEYAKSACGYGKASKAIRVW